MKIVSFVENADIQPEQRGDLKKIGEFIDAYHEKMSSEEVIKNIADAEIIIVGSDNIEKIDAQMLEACKNLKLIATVSVGTEFIDAKKATELGIKISNVHGANAESVAEHAWGLILSLSKKITEAHIGTKAGRNDVWLYKGIELQGKTIGIIGLGEIGSKVARIANGFEMRVIGHTRSGKNKHGIESVSLENLLKQSDVIVTTVPLTDDTANLISFEQVSLMKKNVILINPAREGIVDREAILKGLEEGKIFGFGLEINFGTEPDQRYYKYENVVITPHNAFLTEEANQKTSALVVENIAKFIEGKPQNVVN